MKYNNPIISGYHPDPSICRVEEDYYIVNSTFEFFPGVPVYHSRNLVNWKLKGYCLTSREQDQLEKCQPSGGIYAPTLRYHEGTFFMITTNVSYGGNFIVHTTDMAQGWSEPHYVDQGGIDPSLLFDEDGKVYFTSTGEDEQGRQGIFLCQVNPFTGERLTKSVCISHGSGGKCPEGPHLYKRFGKYYLMLAEGGTEYGHMETIHRSDSPYGPFEPCPHNPILTHRHQSSGEICCTGHADLLEDYNGNWWLVCLATRSTGRSPYFVMQHHLGRETFLTPVRWTEDGWPVVGDQGEIALEMDGPLPGPAPTRVERSFRDSFGEEQFDLHYNFIRNPHMENYRIDAEKGQLILTGTDVTLNDVDSPTWIGVRQKEFDLEASVQVSLLQAGEGVRAGLTAFYNDSYHYDLYLTRKGDSCSVCLAKHVHDIFAVTACGELSGTDGVELIIRADREKYSFYYRQAGEDEKLLGTGLAVGLCTEGTKTMTFTGTYIGMFAEHGKAAFENFRAETGQPVCGKE